MPAGHRARSANIRVIYRRQLPLQFSFGWPSGKEAKKEDKGKTRRLLTGHFISGVSFNDLLCSASNQAKLM